MISNSILERRFHLVREDPGKEDEFYKYYDSIDHMVPETTFNNMHGKLKDVRSVDGQMWQITLRKREDSAKPLQRSTKKSSNGEFKMNVSGWWSKDDVWGTSGWEVSSKIKGTLATYGKIRLSWKDYDVAGKSSTLFLQHLAQMNWPEQSRFKAVFDKYLKTIQKKKSVSKVFEDSEIGIENSKTISTEPGRKHLPQSIGLKQLGRSIKYMTAAEKREEQKKKGKNMMLKVSRFNYMRL